MRDYHHFLFYSRHTEKDHLFLDADEAHHAAIVLRLQKNDPFIATDGKGTMFTCSLDSIAKKGLSGIITSRIVHPRHSCDLRLLVGIPERAVFESLLVDLAALGVRRITPVICTHCQQPWWGHNREKHSERFLSKMISGMKQSLYPYLPDLDTPMNFEQALSTISGCNMVADADGSHFNRALMSFPAGNKSFSAVVGPPGGLSFEELSGLEEKGVVAVKIAPTRLTTELASVVLSGLIIGINNC